MAQLRAESLRNKEDVLAIARQPMPKMIDIETLKKEQNYSTAALRLHYQQKDMSLWEDEDVFELLD